MAPDFVLEADLRTALELFLFLKTREQDLSGAPAELFERLRGFLYEHLSIEEMEQPEAFLDRLGRDRR